MSSLQLIPDIGCVTTVLKFRNTRPLFRLTMILYHFFPLYQHPTYAKSWMVSITFSTVLLVIFILSKVQSGQPSAGKMVNAIGGLVFMCVMFYPTVVLMAVDMFNCIQGGLEPEDTFLRVDLRIACDEGHAAMESTVGVWLWILAAVFVPVLFYLLKKESHSLDSIATLTKFGYLYKGLYPICIHFPTFLLSVYRPTII